jgi:hypothetical protein
MAAILVAPKLKDYVWDGRTHARACESWLASSILLAHKIMAMINSTFGSKQ